ncbi:MAG: ABC transporter ATP-binding protein [Desulfobacteraceae bacterium]|nr:ABC transporter ATP-binding protein [Desulfobacteraceae bacterium]
MGLEIKSISKKMDDKVVLESISFSIDAGSILCLLGPSGCGKTTLLRIIAGLETPDSGDVLFHGKSITKISPHKRNFGMMFQDFALFPHKNVFENVMFGLEMKGISKSEIKTRVIEMLNVTGLSGFEKRSIAGLSGGEKQRVALARSLVPQPSLLMLDEPLGSLDRALREKLMVDLKNILKKVGVTAVFVTHDQAEAYAVADSIAVFSKGKIEQIASSQKIYRYPVNKFVASFLGFNNIFPGVQIEDGLIQTQIGKFKIGKLPAVNMGTKVLILIRPEYIFLAESNGGKIGEKIGEKLDEKIGENDDGNDVFLEGIITSAIFKGQFYSVTFEPSCSAKTKKLYFDVGYHLNPTPGTKTFVRINKGGVLIIEDIG